MQTSIPRGRSGAPRPQGAAGFSLVEVLIAVTILVLASLSLAAAFSSSASASQSSDRAIASRTSIEGVYEQLGDVAYEQLLSWNGVQVDRGDHTVTVEANLVQVGLVVLEITATDDRTGAVLGRLATYRSGGP